VTNKCTIISQIITLLHFLCFADRASQYICTGRPLIGVMIPDAV